MAKIVDLIRPHVWWICVAAGSTCLIHDLTSVGCVLVVLGFSKS
jgi:hypothetical protein